MRYWSYGLWEPGVFYHAFVLELNPETLTMQKSLISMVLWLSPNHWNTKTEALSFSFGPRFLYMTNKHNTWPTDRMRCPRFILITQNKQSILFSQILWHLGTALRLSYNHIYSRRHLDHVDIFFYNKPWFTCFLPIPLMYKYKKKGLSHNKNFN